MCTNCNEITIPTGAPGAPGANGTNGTNGVKGDTGLTGANGQNGENGLHILYNNVTLHANTLLAGTQTLDNYTVLANELNNNGDELELDIICSIALAASGTGIIIIQLGSNSDSINLVDLTTLRINIKFSRIDASNILRSTQYIIDNGTTTISKIRIQSELFNCTVNNPIYLKSSLSNNGIDQLNIYKCTIYKNKI